MPNQKVRDELKKFFTGLADDTNLAAFKKDVEGYTKKEKEKGVIGDEAEQLILARDTKVIHKELIAPMRVVYPPLAPPPM